MEGLVFDIQRSSLNDGPGIRTTIFLKGCPLSCLWCHNEESIDPSPILRYFPDKCINCMECVSVCKSGAQINENGRHKLNFKSCLHNWDCIEVCPSGALVKTGRKMPVSEIIEIVKKDVLYYKNTGGGITLSGGEPMLQFQFTKALLKAAKENGIHTCLDTTGFAPWERYSELLGFTDLFLFDYKETDSELHQDYTSVGNELILENLAKLDDAGSLIILRCPLIPGLNDRDEHFEAIARLSIKHSSISEVHILPYHTMGMGKAGQHGLGNRQKEFRVASEDEKMKWKEILEHFGALNFTIF